MTRGKRLGQFSLTGSVVRSRMLWAGHVVQTEEGRLPKKAEAMKY